jgi:isoquinoline 1-oxidoreductase beta subunit
MSEPGGERPSRVARVSRRDFLVATGAALVAGGGGLLLGVWYGRSKERWTMRVPPREQPFAPNVYLAIDTGGETTIWLTRSEMGQGVTTALPMLLAEELDADWSMVRVEQALANRNYGGQLTGSSASVRGLWAPLRHAGASAREMLVRAAAAQWVVPVGECTTQRGAVVHEPTGRRVGYGALAQAAARLPVPEAPRLKAPAERSLLGRPLPRLDVPSKVDGRARYGLDVRLPGMRFATVVRCPVFGGKVESFDATSVGGRAGVHSVFEIDSGVAIVADTTWAALSAAAALQVRWANPPGPAFDDRELAKQLDHALDGPGQTVREEGDATRWQGARVVEARYRAPYLAHATMEPINATAWMRDGRCEIWAPTQAPDGAQEIGAELTGLPLPDVVVHVTQLGGGFGRRAANVEVRDAVLIAKRVSGPVQVVWSREADVQHDLYRSVSHHRLEAALDDTGKPVAWRHRVATPSMQGLNSADGKVDRLMLDGATEVPYAFERIEVRWASVASPVPLGFWRSVAHSYNAYAVECFLDEVALAGGRDPVQLRRDLLRGSPRHLAVLDRVAELAGWASPAPDGVGRGVAVHASFGSFVAMVAEVTKGQGGVRVQRVFAAVDCGQYVNPQIIEAQVEGGIAFGLSAALYGRIDVREGRAVQSNFHDYRMLRLPEMPRVQIAILDSGHEPGGVGEIAVPPIAPAVANALARLTGQPMRELPLGA